MNNTISTTIWCCRSLIYNYLCMCGFNQSLPKSALSSSFSNSNIDLLPACLCSPLQLFHPVFPSLDWLLKPGLTSQLHIYLSKWLSTLLSLHGVCSLLHNPTLSLLPACKGVFRGFCVVKRWNGLCAILCLKQSTFYEALQLSIYMAWGFKLWKNMIVIAYKASDCSWGLWLSCLHDWRWCARPPGVLFKSR